MGRVREIFLFERAKRAIPLARLNKTLEATLTRKSSIALAGNAKRNVCDFFCSFSSWEKFFVLFSFRHFVCKSLGGISTSVWEDCAKAKHPVRSGYRTRRLYCLGGEMYAEFHGAVVVRRRRDFNRLPFRANLSSFGISFAKNERFPGHFIFLLFIIEKYYGETFSMQRNYW